MDIHYNSLINFKKGFFETFNSMPHDSHTGVSQLLNKFLPDYFKEICLDPNGGVTSFEESGKAYKILYLEDMMKELKDA